MAGAHFRIVTDELGGGTLHVNGDDLSDQVRGLRLEAAKGAPTTLTLWSVGDAVIEADGVVVHEVPIAPVDTMRRFLAQIDPKVLEGKALERAGWDDAPLTRHVFDLLIEIAEGKA